MAVQGEWFRRRVEEFVVRIYPLLHRLTQSRGQSIRCQANVHYSHQKPHVPVAGDVGDLEDQ